jgi:hypothetical protein
MRYPLAQSSVFSNLPNPLFLMLRSPRNLAMATAGGAVVAGIAWAVLRRPRTSAEEIERRRRNLLALTGRITDGSIIDIRLQQDSGDAAPLLIVYDYRIAGVSYECAQDVTALAEHVRDIRADLPVQVRYDPHNPANSIVVAESWNGLRISPSPLHESH